MTASLVGTPANVATGATYTPGAGTNRAVWLAAMCESASNRTLNTPTLGGVNGHFVVREGGTNGGVENAELWYWLESELGGGALTLSATWSGTANGSIFRLGTLQDVDQSTPIDNSGTGEAASGTTGSISGGLDTTEFIVAACVRSGSTASETWTSPLSTDTNASSGSTHDYTTGTGVGTGAATPVELTWTTSRNWCMVAAAFKGAASGTNQDADFSSGASVGSTFAAVSAALGAVTAATGAGATFAAIAATTDTITAGVNAAHTLSAQAAAIASITAAVGAGEAEARFRGTTSAITAGASADSVLAAISEAVAAISAGIAAGEAWASQAAAAAQLAATGNFGSEFAEATQAGESGAISEGTEAAASFLAAAETLAALTAGATTGASIAAIAATIGQMVSTANLGATFTSLFESDALIQGSIDADAVFALFAATVGAIASSVSASDLYQSSAASLGAWAEAASFAAVFSAQGGISEILPAPKASGAAVAKVRTVQMTPKARQARAFERTRTKLLN